MTSAYTIIREDGAFYAILHTSTGDIQSAPLASALEAEDWAELTYHAVTHQADDSYDDGQPSEMQEWHDFDPDC